MSLPEHHFSHRAGWLRAAVLGANDGIVSTASLVLGVAAANADGSAVLLAGLAGLVAGAMSMAAGEYVSVSSQADMESADLQREKQAHEDDNLYEHQELANIYIERGLEPALARQVAAQLMAKDGLEAHARDELGITTSYKARPIQAALTSGATFSVGAALPLLLTAASPAGKMTLAVGGGSLITLAGLGLLAAHAGGADLVRGALRVTFWGTLAMAATMAVGSLFGPVL
jgi:vacuolar iron transporter family protein